MPQLRAGMVTRGLERVRALRPGHRGPRLRRRPRDHGAGVKLAVVTPRYGDDIAGGAETAARLLATELVGAHGLAGRGADHHRGDATTWADEYPPRIDRPSTGSTVHRFPVHARAASDFDRLCARRSYRRGAASDDEQARVGGGAGSVLARAHRGDRAERRRRRRVPSVPVPPDRRGLPLVARGAVLHPAAHDEAPIRLPIYREIFLAAAGLVYWSEAERRFTERLFPVAARRSSSSGSASSPSQVTRRTRRRRAGLGDGRSSCVSDASTTARARACSPNASRGTSTRRPGDLQPRVRRAGDGRAAAPIPTSCRGGASTRT